MNVLIYCHKNKINNKIYIGQTSQRNPEQRWMKGLGYKNNTHFYNAIQKYGWDNFEHIILEKNLSLEEANKREIFWIAYFNSTNPDYGYNIQAGGKNSLHSETTKEKIRQKALQWSNETKKKMSDSAKKRVQRDGAPFQGKHFSEEAKEKLRQVDRSYTQTAEYRENMSKIKLGGKNGQAKKVRAFNSNEEKVFECKKDAINFLGLSRSSEKFLNKAIKNKTLYHNYYWEEIKE